MLCPFCGNENTKVLESRQSREKTSIRRRRECEDCLKRFTTFERFEVYSLMVVKKDRTKEKFSREKILKSISNACIKTHVSPHLIEKIAESIEVEASKANRKEISTGFIGKKVLSHLKDINEIAYLRYLSIFKGYTNLEELLNEMKIKNPV